MPALGERNARRFRSRGWYPQRPSASAFHRRAGRTCVPNRGRGWAGGKSAAAHRVGWGFARELSVSLNTLRTHTKSIYAKLGVNNRRAAVRQAAELNLLSRTRDR